MPTATVTSKGQVTIPVEVRRRLGIQTGTRIDFVWRGDGRVEIVPATRSIMELRGIVPSIGRPVTIEEMNEAIAEGAVESGMP